MGRRGLVWSAARHRSGAILALTVLLVAVICPVTASSQLSTEQFIPIGQSPGLSGIVTYVGEIAEADPGTRTVTMRRPTDVETITVRVAQSTRIWLDRSSVGRSNLSGSFADLAPGSVVEIHFVDPQRRRFADWIKVESDRPD